MTQPKRKVVKAKPVRKTCHAPKYRGQCPKCGRGKLDYNGLIELYCPVCSYVVGNAGFS